MKDTVLCAGEHCLGSHRHHSQKSIKKKKGLAGLEREDREGDMETGMWGQTPCHTQGSINGPLLPLHQGPNFGKKDLVF